MLTEVDNVGFDLALQGVDPRIGRDDVAGKCRVAPIERVQRITDLALRKAAHLGNHPRQLLKVGIECLDGVLGHHGASLAVFGPPAAVHPNRPVM